MTNAIENQCACGACVYFFKTGVWASRAGGGPIDWSFCPYCGWKLLRQGIKGIARKTVVLPEEPIELELATNLVEGLGGGHPVKAYRVGSANLLADGYWLGDEEITYVCADAADKSDYPSAGQKVKGYFIPEEPTDDS